MPHTARGLRKETVESLRPEDQLHHLELRQLDDDEGYWRLWHELWAAGVDLLIVEQDIAVNPTTVEELEWCGGEWCAFPYEYDIANGEYYGTGCVRIRASLTARHPDLIDRVGRLSNHNHPPRHWCTLDAWIQQLLAQAGETMCRHQPTVQHLNPSCSHGCHGS